jgi:hypothetical protein
VNYLKAIFEMASRGKARDMNLRKAFTDPFEDKAWMTKLGWNKKANSTRRTNE